MIPYHGGPITPETCAYRVWRGRHAFVSWPRSEQITLAASVCQSFALDNGAYSLWKEHKPVDWLDYYEWCDKWLRHPACDWAVIPDVIAGSEDDNDALIEEWPHRFRQLGVPVWHVHESVERLVRLADVWPRVALGAAVGLDPDVVLDRLAEALPAISRDGTPLVKLHGLGLLNTSITSVVPLSSADSTNVARNIKIDKAWTGSYAPATKETRADVLIERIESTPTPMVMAPRAIPGRLFGVEVAR